MDAAHDPGVSAIALLESELIVRDFIQLVNDGCIDEMSPFLAPDVVYKSSASHGVHGRRAVQAMWEEILATFEWVAIELVEVAVNERLVLAEQQLPLKLPGQRPQQKLGLASFRIRDFQIATWHQLPS